MQQQHEPHVCLRVSKLRICFSNLRSAANRELPRTVACSGQEFPVHPLDLTYPLPVTLSVNGWDTAVTLCVNTYRYLTSEPTASDGFDIILGDEFLRNVYTS